MALKRYHEKNIVRCTVRESRVFAYCMCKVRDGLRHTFEFRRSSPSPQSSVIPAACMPTAKTRSRKRRPSATRANLRANDSHVAANSSEINRHHRQNSDDVFIRRTHSGDDVRIHAVHARAHAHARASRRYCEARIFSLPPNRRGNI
jgi:hypothetical protein